jgi:hypothetical protein
VKGSVSRIFTRADDLFMTYPPYSGQNHGERKDAPWTNGGVAGSRDCWLVDTAQDSLRGEET